MTRTISFPVYVIEGGAVGFTGCDFGKACFPVLTFLGSGCGVTWLIGDLSAPGRDCQARSLECPANEANR